MSIDKEKKPVKTTAKPGKAATKTAAAKVEKPKAVAKPKSAAATKAAPKATKVAASTVSDVQGSRQPASKPRPTHEQIAHVAYGYFLQRHGQHGHHDEDWLRAERELLRLL